MQSTVLILQGGGALGAYQAGVYQHLSEQHTEVDWVIGTSIGAINAALIAGNPPHTRVAQIKAFWDSLTPSQPDPLTAWWLSLPPLANLAHSMNTMGILMKGVHGFFTPRLGASADINAKVPLNEMGFYDTSALKTTLEKYVDFEYLNRGAMRLSICAVDIDSGQSAVFDSKKQVILPEHIMASGALPPGFPPIQIDDKAYWDGGVYSNSPLSVFLAEVRQKDALCFMVDLWDPTEIRPTSIAEGLARYKSIQYASRSKELLENYQQIANLQKAIRLLADKIPGAERQQETTQMLLAMGCDHTVNVVNLIMKASEQDHYFKDIDFSRETIAARWQDGIHDCKRALQHKAWLVPLPPHAGLVIHELPQE
ncbi:patatin-like phospholipase family protein [Undibacterium sp.]|uniref:patatin-like phospholipase family protein n=1 Tax=Undibacterium sp. TaxID=1914977 RepID=UPI0025E6B04B|nr:patatin-like phospholipase family protein [Undibacterium sp.]